MKTKLSTAATLLLAGAVWACGDSSPTDDSPPPPSAVAEWKATHVAGVAVPGLLYLFDPDSINGQPVSVHIILDSAKLVVRGDGRYEHRIWASHWVGEPGGPPLERTVRFFHGDHGSWGGTSDALEFESEWLQNHRMTGALTPDALEMSHGFSHGDPPVAVRYGR